MSAPHVKETPILFSEPMVQAIMAGRKTQTRRVVNWERLHKQAGLPYPTNCSLAWFNLCKGWALDAGDGMMREVDCPYGKVGDRLWVKETWAPNPRAPQGREADAPYVLYRANGDTAPGWRPSIFMSRLGSRITLEVAAVRVARLNDISEADAAAEGVTPAAANAQGAALAGIFGATEFMPHRSAYATLWEQINGYGAWDANPWVWVIEFRRLAP